MIDEYSFGVMTVGGEKYTSDVILYPDGSMNSSWWRKSGHLLRVEDLDRTGKVHPEIAIIGTGAWGRMRVDRKVMEYLHSLCKRVIVEKTGSAVKEYNTLVPSHSVVGLFHLTC
jgi:hypothetical protein